MSEDEKNRREILMAYVKQFVQAAIDLQGAWEQASQELQTGELLCDDYPFTDHFDEVVLKMIGWRDANNV